MKKISLILCAIIASVLIAKSDLYAQEEQSAFEVEIEIVRDQLQGHTASVDIYLNRAQSSFSGFDFRIAYDKNGLISVDVEPGVYLEDCGWEYFTYRIWPVDTSDGIYPSGLLRIIGSLSNNENPSFCPVDSPVTLATMNFMITNDRDYECVALPLQFYWTGCGDNKIYSQNSDTIYISNHVYDFDYDQINKDTLLPTLTGAPSFCEQGIPDDWDKTAIRGIDFKNGVIYTICPIDIDDRCDLNLNGIVNEIEDAIILKNYFLEGLSAFSDPEWQIPCTDFNGDSIPLTIEDFVYLIRYITGDAQTLDLDTVYNCDLFISQDEDVLLGSITSQLPLGAFIASFDIHHGTIDSLVLNEELSEFELVSFANSTVLKILIFSFNENAVIPAHLTDLFKIYHVGPIELYYADAAGYYGEKVDVNINLAGIEPFAFAIGIARDQIQGHHSYLNVTKQAGSQELYGFDFLIGFDAAVLTFIAAPPGDLFEEDGEYQWEYFTYRYSWNGDCEDDCPSGLIRVVGMADKNDGPHHALSHNVPDGMALFTLDFLVTNDRTYECTYNPVSFYWVDCGDNTVAASCINYGCPEVQTLLSSYVFNRYPDSSLDISDSLSEFPTYLGASNDCIGTPNPPHPPAARFVDFHNGAVDIVCHGCIDDIGDVNLNGVVNEIADAVVFSNYFIFGLAAFTVNVEGQIAATDLNGDDLPLTIEDFVYLIRIIMGDAMPYPNDYTFSGTLNNVPEGNQVVLHSTFEDDIGALHLIYTGNVDFTIDPEIGHMDVKSGFDGENTRILIYSFDKNAVINANQNIILNIVYSGEAPELIYGAAAGYNGEKVDLTIQNDFVTAAENKEQLNLPAEFRLLQNHPNPFNISTEIKFDLPKNAEWRLEIYNIKGQRIKTYSGSDPAGTLSIQWHGADENGQELASGIYFYRLQAGEFKDSKKMILLK